MNNTLFNQLITRYLKDEVSPDEKKLVEGYYEHLSNGKLKLTQEEENIIKSKVKEGIIIGTKEDSKVFNLYFNKWTVAASAIIIIITSCIFWFNSGKKINRTFVLHTNEKNILPANGNIILTFSNGQKIVIDSAKNGQLNIGNGSNINKQNGILVFTPSQIRTYNTLSTEKGKNFHIVLSDGSQVWMDAESSIKFPSTFLDKERIVELNGQAYFEIAHDSKHPFKVKIGENIVKVLGTHFNIDGYKNRIKVTLLEGSICAQTKKDSIRIKPGEQAQMSTTKITVKKVDTSSVVAWKYGYFKFLNTNINTTLDILSKWYDIDIIYEDKIPNLFIADINKKEPLSRVLELLEMTNAVHFTIKGRTVIVHK